MDILEHYVPVAHPNGKWTLKETPKITFDDITLDAENPFLHYILTSMRENPFKHFVDKIYSAGLTYIEYILNEKVDAFNFHNELGDRVNQVLLGSPYLPSDVR